MPEISRLSVTSVYSVICHLLFCCIFPSYIIASLLAQCSGEHQYNLVAISSCTHLVMLLMLIFNSRYTTYTVKNHFTYYYCSTYNVYYRDLSSLLIQGILYSISNITIRTAIVSCFQKNKTPPLIRSNAA